MDLRIFVEEFMMTFIWIYYYSDSSKQRIELKKQMRRYIEKAENLVEVINPQLDGNVVTMHDCYRGIFPWQSLYDGIHIIEF